MKNNLNHFHKLFHSLSLSFSTLRFICHKSWFIRSVFRKCCYSKWKNLVHLFWLRKLFNLCQICHVWRQDWCSINEKLRLIPSKASINYVHWASFIMKSAYISISLVVWLCSFAQHLFCSFSLDTIYLMAIRQNRKGWIYYFKLKIAGQLFLYTELGVNESFLMKSCSSSEIN